MNLIHIWPLASVGTSKSPTLTATMPVFSPKAFSLLAPDGSVWPVFNLADSSICCGGVLLVLLALTGRELDGTRTVREAASPTAGS